MTGVCEGDMTCHVVLWIPTIVYQGFSGSKGGSIEKNISDIPDKEHYVRVSLHEDGNVQVDAMSNEGVYEPFVTLIREDVSSNGLMCFTYKSTSDKEHDGFRFTTKEFPTAIYHIIKDFYHIHEFHDGENDSSLSPYVASHKICIKDDDNEALLHYLKTYGNVISTFVGYLQLAIRKARAVKGAVSPEARDLIKDMCLKARGYEVYMGVLYRSRYNTMCRPDNTANRDLRHIACNIENGLRYIRLIEHEFGEYMQQSFVDEMIKDAKNSLHSSKLSMGIGWGSIVLGIISLIVAFVISARSTRELNDVRHSLQQQLDSIPSFMQESAARDKEIIMQQEDLSQTQSGFDARLERIENRLNIIIRNQVK